MPPTSRARRRRRGFSLLEVVVTMVLLTVLAALGAVGYNAARTKGTDSVHQSELRQWATSLQSYNTSRGVWPSAATAASLEPGRTWAASPTPASADGKTLSLRTNTVAGGGTAPWLGLGYYAGGKCLLLATPPASSGLAARTGFGASQATCTGDAALALSGAAW